MPLRAKQIAAATAVVGATILGGAGLVAAQDADDSPTTTVPDESTTEPDHGSSDGREAPPDGMRPGPDRREHARGENCPDKGDGSSDTEGDADGHTEADTEASSLAA